MADSVSGSSAEQVGRNYDKYKDMFATKSNDSLGQSDFLKLLTEQLKNQDFNNPTDNTEFIAQMAQFSQLQSLQAMTYYSRASYATSLVGKNVAVAGFDARGNFKKDEGIVTSVRMEDEDFIFTINGNEYTSQNIMEVKAWTVSGGDSAGDKDEDSSEGNEEDKTEGTEGNQVASVIENVLDGTVTVIDKDGNSTTTNVGGESSSDDVSDIIDKLLEGIS